MWRTKTSENKRRLYVFVSASILLFLGLLSLVLPTHKAYASSCPTNYSPASQIPVCWMSEFNTMASVTLDNGQKITNFSGYKIIQNGKNYYLTDGQGNIMGQLPNSLTVTIHGTKSGINLDTWKQDPNKSGYFISTGGHQSLGPFINSSNHQLTYETFIAGMSDPSYKVKKSYEYENFRICTSGSGFSSGSNCVLNPLDAGNTNGSYLTIPEHVIGNLKLSGTLQKFYNYEVSGGSLLVCQSNNPNDKTCSTVFGQNKSGNPNEFICNQLNCPGLSSQDTITVGSQCGSAVLASYGSSGEIGPPQQINIAIHNLSVVQNNQYGMVCSTNGQSSLLKSSSSAAVSQKSGGSSTSSSASSTPTCEASGGVLDWVFCATFNALNKITSVVLTDFIMPELRTNPICISSTGSGCQSGDPTYQIWANFRLYGDIILVIALLVVVISEAAGGGLLDAYTVRKMLPRILVAGILLNLSIYIFAALIDVTNIIGGSIGAVITSPLSSAAAFKISPSGGVNIGGGVLAAAGAGGLIFGLTSLSSIFSAQGGALLVNLVLVPAILIFLAILITIIIRKTILVALLILSPIAFAFYCLPNTQKYFKRWWDVLMEMLMIYPIIVLIFAVSSVMSVLITLPSANINPLQSGANALMSLAFTIIPLVLVPFSFKFAGDTLGRIHSFVENGRSAASKLHANRRKTARQAYQLRHAGDVARQYGWLNNTRAGRALLNARGGRGVPVIGRAYQGRATRATQRATLAAGETGQLPNARTVEHDDNALVALTNRGDFNRTWREIQESARLRGNQMTDDAAQAEARRAISAARTAVGFGQSQAVWAARQRGVTGTGYASLDQMERTIAQTAAGNASIRSSLSGDLNSIVKQTGRHDLAAGFGNINEAADLYDARGRGQATIQDAQGHTVNVDDQLNTIRGRNVESAWQSGSIYEHANDKPADIDAAIAHFTPMLHMEATGPLTDAQTDEQDRAIAFFQELSQLKGVAKGEVRERTAQALEQTNAAGTVTTENFVANLLSPSVASAPAFNARTRMPTTGSPIPNANYVGEERAARIGRRVRNSSAELERLNRAGGAGGGGAGGGGAGGAAGGGGAGGGP